MDELIRRMRERCDADAKLSTDEWRRLYHETFEELRAALNPSTPGEVAAEPERPPRDRR
jgi:hypothetical protein